MVEGEGWPPWRSLARSAFDSKETGVDPGGRTMDWDWLTGIDGATGAGRAVGMGVVAGRLLPALALVRREEEDDGDVEEGGGLVDLSLSPRAMTSRTGRVLLLAALSVVWGGGRGCSGLSVNACTDWEQNPDEQTTRAGLGVS